jgi:hypothetical protein
LFHSAWCGAWLQQSETAEKAATPERVWEIVPAAGDAFEIEVGGDF